MSQDYVGADLGGRQKGKAASGKATGRNRPTEEIKVMGTQEKVKEATLVPRRCSICHGGPSEGLGEIIRYGGKLVPRTLRYSDNAWAHRLCIPTHLRQPGIRFEERRMP